MAADTVRFGIVGTGGMGSGHCNMMAQIPEAQLAALCDVNPDTLQPLAAKYDVPAFATHQELLDSGLVDAVIIATPHYFHPPIAEDAFAKGIHVLSEKPLGVTVGAVDKMIAAAKASGLKFGAMFQMRAEPQNQAAKQIVASGALGEHLPHQSGNGLVSQSGVLQFGRMAGNVGGRGRRRTHQSGPALSRPVHLARRPADQPLRAMSRTRLHDIEVEDEAFATLEYPNGAHGYLYASTTEVPRHNMLEICGDQGKIVLHGSTLKHYAVDGSIREFTTNATEMWGSPKTEEMPVTLPPAPDARRPCRHHAELCPRHSARRTAHRSRRRRLERGRTHQRHHPVG